MFIKRIVCGLFLLSICYAAPKKNILIQQWTLENGARIYLVEAHKLPMIDIQVLFDAGSARDGSQSGLAQLTTAMLNDGSHHHTEEQLALGFDQIGAQFGNNTTCDAASVSLRTLTNPQQLNPALALFAEIINDPIFPHHTFLREQKSALMNITQSQQDPATIASMAFYKMIFDQQPYALPTIGTADAVKKISVSDTQRFYKKYYVGKNAVMVMMGDVNRQQAEKIATQLLGSLPTGVAAPPLASSYLATKAQQKNISFPAQQNTILIGQVGINYNNPDFFALSVGNYILGGNPGVSRLFNEVRAKRGLSYQIESFFTPMLARGPFTIMLQTNSAQTKQALAIIKDTYNHFVTDGPTPAELSSAKQSITGSFPLSLDSNSSILSAVAVIGFYRLPLDFLDTFNDHINAVTAEQIKTAFQKNLDYKNMDVVIVGK